eukprot:CAMPEP_0118934954 /NCGR_PEP_ID=MMETSP1169-20130426/14587_1 /TAXON_ID=36882 /ORGANISM="Pyramimonas obovata, Strain CCMP722" /LENGTH=158 /DNA_ID=CAMNT_0006877919 /DNA_START=43 /DNA_END=519 /DNA_ORIENTATION=+
MASFTMRAAICPVAVSSRAAQVAPERASMPSAKVFAKGTRSASLRASTKNARPMVLRALPETAEDAAVAKPAPPKLAKGNFCQVDKEKYVGSVEALANHDHNMTGLDYIFEPRGEVLEVREFSKGPYALVAWVGIPTAPAWLPVSMLDKVEKLVYQRI